jgi:hypothetical protein
MHDQGNRDLPDPTDEHDRKLLADVGGHGWHVLGVEADAEGPAFAYSVGLYHTFGHAEIIVFGLGVDAMFAIVNGIGETVGAGGKFGDLDEAGDVLEGYHVIFRDVEKRHYREYLGYALWFYQGDGFATLQCVWPDSAHRYPWHPSFSQALSTRQPVLSGDKSWTFQAGRNRAVFTSKRVTRAGRPVLLVVHDEDGDWQFLCGSTNRQKDAQLVSLGHVIDLDPGLAELANLPEGWRASREAAGAAWTREPMRQGEG